jgi:anti-sigma factor RsiW
MSCDHLLATQSYLDGELKGVEAAEAERHLQTCAECQAFASEAAELSDRLRKSPRHTAPAHLRAAVLAQLDREPVPLPRRSFWLGTASGAGVSALAAALVIAAILPPSAAGLAAAVIDAHTHALVNGPLIMVASSNHHTVKPWLAAHAGISPPVTDFAPEGFALAGGRLDEVAGTRAAVMIYRHGNHQIDLFAWPDRGARLPAPGMAHGFRSLFWKQGDLDFAAVSDVDAAAFEKFTALARAPRE